MLVCPYQLVQRVVEVVQASVQEVEVFAPVQEVLLTPGARASVQVVVASAPVGLLQQVGQPVQVGLLLLEVQVWGQVEQALALEVWLQQVGLQVWEGLLLLVVQT